jgi:hypothetical protein
MIRSITATVDAPGPGTDSGGQPVRRQGPVIAYIVPGTCTFANSTAPSAEKTGPVNSPPSWRAIG